MRLLDEEFVKSRVSEWLGKNDYIIVKSRTLTEHGVDLKARKARSNNYFLVECRGEPQTNPQKLRHPMLISGLGEILQRVAYDRHYRFALALPESYRELVERRIPFVAAKRLGLDIVLVSERGKIDRLTWRELKSRQ